MMVDIEVALRIGVYVALIVLLVVLIIFGLKLIKTMKKVDNILDNVDEKMNQVNGLFNIIDKTTDFAVGISDKIVGKISKLIEMVFKRKRGNDLDD